MDMNPQENVVKGVFDPLERRALRIEAAMKRRAKGDQEWIEGTIDLAVEMAGARAEFPSNGKFGEWFDGRFTNISKTPGHQERAILIRWGKNPDATRARLETAQTRSIQLIDGGWVPAAKRGRQRGSTSKVMDAALEAVQRLKEETGDLPPAKQVAEETSFGRHTAERALYTAKKIEEAADEIGDNSKLQAALAYVRSYKARTGEYPPRSHHQEAGVSHTIFEAAQIAIREAEAAKAEVLADVANTAHEASLKFTKAQQHDIDMIVKRRLKELEKEFAAKDAAFALECNKLIQDFEKTKAQWMANYHAEVAKACKENEAKRFPLLQERENKAHRAEQRYRELISAKAIFSPAQAKTILMCLHPDGVNSRSLEKLHDAFLLFNGKIPILTGES